LVCRYNFLNQRFALEPLGAIVGSTPVLWGGGPASSTVGLCSARRSRTSSACYSGAPLACCSGTSSPLFACSSTHVLRRGVSVLDGGATGISLSSDHSNTMVLHVRVVWSPPSEMPPSLRGAAAAVFLLFWVGSSIVALFPWIFSNTRDGLSDETLTVSSLGCSGGRESTPFGQLLLGTPKKYTVLSYEWIFA